MLATQHRASFFEEWGHFAEKYLWRKPQLSNELLM
jgi:hypothetical protein